MFFFFFASKWTSMAVVCLEVCLYRYGMCKINASGFSKKENSTSIYAQKIPLNTITAVLFRNGYLL